MWLGGGGAFFRLGRGKPYAKKKTGGWSSNEVSVSNYSCCAIYLGEEIALRKRGKKGKHKK